MRPLASKHWTTDLEVCMLIPFMMSEDNLSQFFLKHKMLEKINYHFLHFRPLKLKSLKIWDSHLVENQISYRLSPKNCNLIHYWLTYESNVDLFWAKIWKLWRHSDVIFFFKKKSLKNIKHFDTIQPDKFPTGTRSLVRLFRTKPEL